MVNTKYLIWTWTWTWTWTWSAMLFPIILVFQMSDFWYEIKTELKLRYLLSDLKILTLKIRVRSYATNDTHGILNLGWSGRWLSWRDRPQTDPPNDWQWDLNKKRYYHSSDRYCFIDHHFLTLHWLGNRIFNVITDYLPFVNHTYRKPSNWL